MLGKIFPFLNWFDNYSRQKLRQDVISGLTVALILIPQSMAYAQLSGLPSYYGLYAAFLPPLVAALFGSSFHLSTGPVAVVSLMTAATLEPLAIAGSQAFIEYAIVLALVVGIFQFCLGFLRLGLIVNFISHPVIYGFTSAAAIIIAASQLTKFLGIYVDDSEHFYETVWYTFLSASRYIHLPTFLMGVSALVIIYLVNKFTPRLPGVLIAVIVTTLFAWYTGFEHNYNARIEDFKSPEFRQLIYDFNNEVRLIKQDMNERTGLLSKMEVMRQAISNYLKLLDMEYYDARLGYRLGQEKYNTHEIREKIRQYRFEAVKSPGGSLSFYVAGNMPKGMASDGRSWILRVSNQELNLASLSMKGGGSVVGDIPRGLPDFTIPALNISSFFKLLPYAIIISLLGFMEAISIAKAIAAKTGQTIDPNQELIGQGLANIIGAFGKSYPVSGSFSRSAVNFQAGAVSGLSSIVTSIFVVITLYFFTPLMHHLPKAVLAAIIIKAVSGLISFKSIRKAGKIKSEDGLVAATTFLCTLYFAPHLDLGIMTGVLLSVAIFLYKSMRPKVVSLSMGSDFSLKPASDYRLKECGHIAAIRFDGTLFFANASYLEEQVLHIISSKPKLKHILIIANGINDIDASGAETLSLLIKRMQSAGYGMSLCGLNEKAMRVAKKAGILKLLGNENLYFNQEDALEDIFFKTHAPGSTNLYACPLLNYMPEEKKEPEKKKSQTVQYLEKIEPNQLILTPTIGTEALRKAWEEKKNKPPDTKSSSK